MNDAYYVNYTAGRVMNEIFLYKRSDEWDFLYKKNDEWDFLYEKNDERDFLYKKSDE